MPASTSSTTRGNTTKARASSAWAARSRIAATSVFLMTKVCTHGRDAKVAMRQLEESLRRLRTDHLDLWQIHECVYYNDPERHFATGGVVEALERAKAAGKVRYVGFTGHKDPEIHLRMLSFDFPFDACQLPLNGFDATFRSFQARVLPELERRRHCRDRHEEPRRRWAGDQEEGCAGGRCPALRHEPSGLHDRIGIDSLKVLRQNLRIARAFSPMTREERTRLRAAPRGRRVGRALRAVQDERRARGRRRPQAARLPVAGRSQPDREAHPRRPAGLRGRRHD